MASEFPAYVTRKIDDSQVEQYLVSTTGGETLTVGEIVIWDDSNNYVKRSGADPGAGTILGISEVDSVAARLLTPDNRIPIRTLTSDSIVAMSSATDYVEGTHRQQEYGITRSSGGKWQVDTAKTTTSARVVVVDGTSATYGPGQNNVWFVKFLAEFLANDGIDS